MNTTATATATAAELAEALGATDRGVAARYLLGEGRFCSITSQPLTPDTVKVPTSDDLGNVWVGQQVTVVSVEPTARGVRVNVRDNGGQLGWFVARAESFITVVS